MFFGFNVIFQFTNNLLNLFLFVILFLWYFPLTIIHFTLKPVDIKKRKKDTINEFNEESFPNVQGKVAHSDTRST